MQGAALIGCGGGLFLGDPDKKVNADPEHLREGVGRKLGGVPALREDPRGEARSLLEGLLRHAVGTRSATTGTENQTEELAFEGPWEGGAGGPQRATGVPKNIKHSVGAGLPTAIAAPKPGYACAGLEEGTTNSPEP